MSDLPVRQWRECEYDDGRVFARGVGGRDLRVLDRFAIEANGQTIAMVVVSLDFPGGWAAQDVASFERSRRA